MIMYNEKRLNQLSKSEKKRLMRDIDKTIEDWCIYYVAGLNDCWGIYSTSKSELLELKAELQK